MKKELPEDTRPLGEKVTQEIRRMLVEGELQPGQRLSEAALSDDLAISRNTLREAFRVLTQEGLLRHEPNRGVFVATPSMASIIDIYRVRRFIECQALAQAWPGHPAIQHLAEAIAAARNCREAQDWLGVGTANMTFHAAIVELADSERLNTFFGHLLAELRLAFGLLRDAEFLHAPYIDMNDQILQLIESGQGQQAAQAMENYLVQSERTLLAAWARGMK